jgi:hypothetical protein
MDHEWRRNNTDDFDGSLGREPTPAKKPRTASLPAQPTAKSGGTPAGRKAAATDFDPNEVDRNFNKAMGFTNEEKSGASGDRSDDGAKGEATFHAAATSRTAPGKAELADVNDVLGSLQTFPSDWKELEEALFRGKSSALYIANQNANKCVWARNSLLAAQKALRAKKKNRPDAVITMLLKDRARKLERTMSAMQKLVSRKQLGYKGVSLPRFNVSSPAKFITALKRAVGRGDKAEAAGRVRAITKSNATLKRLPAAWTKLLEEMNTEDAVGMKHAGKAVRAILDGVERSAAHAKKTIDQAKSEGKGKAPALTALITARTQLISSYATVVGALKPAPTSHRKTRLAALKWAPLQGAESRFQDWIVAARHIEERTVDKAHKKLKKEAATKQQQSAAKRILTVFVGKLKAGMLAFAAKHRNAPRIGEFNSQLAAAEKSLFTYKWGSLGVEGIKTVLVMRSYDVKGMWDKVQAGKMPPERLAGALGSMFSQLLKALPIAPYFKEFTGAWFEGIAKYLTRSQIDRSKEISPPK